VATTHQSAVVLIPPPEVWEPIQAIRRVHDRQFRRWMPHVTLLYPFLPRRALADAVPAAQEALADVASFAVTLARVDVFRHHGGTATVWLAPEPKGALVAVHARLVRRFPECDATGRFAGGFTPHLSVGQARGDEALHGFLRELEGWTPVTFTARQVSVIVREQPPQDVFRVFDEVPFGGASAVHRDAGDGHAWRHLSDREQRVEAPGDRCIARQRYADHR
jgi:2'-5' RNA ligase